MIFNSGLFNNKLQALNVKLHFLVQYLKLLRDVLCFHEDRIPLPFTNTYFVNILEDKCNVSSLFRTFHYFILIENNSKP